MCPGSGTGENVRITAPAPPDKKNDPLPVFSPDVLNVGWVAPVVRVPVAVATRRLYNLSKGTPHAAQAGPR